MFAALAFFAAPVLAGTQSWSWTMNYRYVNGGSNGVYHTFTSGGTMTFAGQVWAYSKDGGANPAPAQITLRVYRQEFPTDVVACIKYITPYSTLNQKKSFTSNCGTEPADTYYIEASTINDDGWNTKGAGTLKLP